MKKAVFPILAALMIGAAAQGQTITHSVSDAIVAGNSVCCNQNRINRGNSYFRTFVLSDFGIDEVWTIDSIQFGVESALSPVDHQQDIEIRIYNNTNLDLLGAPLGGALTYTLADTVNQIITIPITREIITGRFTMEVFTPDGRPDSDVFFIGSNAAGQSSPGYLQSPFCGINTPTSLDQLGFPNMHMVVSVTGHVIPGPGGLTLVSVAGLIAARRRR